MCLFTLFVIAEFLFQATEYSIAFNVFDQAVLAIFTCELLLKWYYGFWIFWKVGWNILDFIIVGALLLGPRKWKILK